ncbi:transposase [Malikia sp.]|uniref:REP-associated tyrosine transposase n=1 Tax=Malikia sp. TaxID=2070706 RepID=UPI0026302CD1|nr:transposase [Malikia sp.]MDD2729205.1 transposase [Malikia sp.]
MARLPRLAVTGVPHHVILRGNNRQAVFIDREDREFFLSQLAELAQREKVQVHAYVLMDNHLHLLLTPQQDGALSRLMQSLGRGYVRRFNLRHGRSGTLWEGRYRSTVIDSERYLLVCMAYIDLNPVRAGMVPAAELYPWSSHGHYIGLRHDKWLTPHPLVWSLGNTPFAREAAYAELVHQGLSAVQQRDLSESVVQGWPLGGAGFLAQLREQTGRRLEKGRAGRPRAVQPAPEPVA